MTDADLTRSEVINIFGEEIGKRLIDGGYSSLTSVIEATDQELLLVPDIGPATLTNIRRMQFTEQDKEEIEDGLEEEAADEPEVEAPEDAEGPGVEEDEAEPDAPIETDEGPADLPEEVLETPSPLPPYSEEPRMSVRVRRIAEANEKAEAEKARQQAMIVAAESEGPAHEDLGSVAPGFVPIVDEIPAVVTIEAEIEVEEVEAEEVETEEIGPDG